MTATIAPMNRTDEMIAAIPAEEPEFAALAERHRRELHVHCYRTSRA